MTNIVSDMKQLVIFDAVMQTRSVSAAAERLGISQPAASTSLSRLREMFNDQLFIRRHDGMEPTRLALSISAQVHEALNGLQDVLRRREFDPIASDWSFDLAVSDHASVVMLPYLVEHVSSVAPRVSLRVGVNPAPDLPERLDSGEIDIAIGVIPHLPARFERCQLFSDRYVCVMRKGHPLASRPLTIADFIGADHLSIRPGKSPLARPDRVLAELGMRRRVVTTVHQYLAAPGVLARSNMVALVFERMQQVFDPREFHFAPLPFMELGVDVEAVWHRTRGKYEAYRWLRSQIMHVTESLRQATKEEWKSPFAAAASSVNSSTV